jgi:hypothetical protein
MLCCGLVISGAALQWDGNQTDSVTVQGGLTERPAEPTYSRDGVKFWENWLHKQVVNLHKCTPK